MSFCTNCGTKLPEGATVCPNCNSIIFVKPGEFTNTSTAANSEPVFTQTAPNQIPPVQNPVHQTPVNTAPPATDHTSEYDKDDISENKVYAMVAALMGIIGAIVCLLANKESKYLRFYVRESLKLAVFESMAIAAYKLLGITIVMPVLAVIFIIGCYVLRIINFCAISQNKVKEMPIVSSFKFMK